MASNTPVALITGAGKRVGAALARAFHQDGFNLVIHCLHSRAEADALAEELNQHRPDSARVLQADLNDLSQVATLAQQTLAQWHRLDLLINNASRFYPTPVGDIDQAAWHDLVGSNMMAPLLLSQALAPTLAEHKGSIINMVDVHARSPLKGHTLYCMAKAALEMMTKSLALELAPRVRVNAIAPGAILWPAQGENESGQQAVLAQVPLGRLGELDEISNTARFLTHHATYLTGQVIAVDGGRSLAPLQGA
ncbi:short-chain dehydrogenase/reductase SDR [Ferrimonas balearica DSM 9799]|uniref:Short-chain dehydrogenase/reductase SDR n=1 Tax=Ferrimonas balearica (strain DSM 9799 / CCM 4581 / KCTC 23876 / PAT) TaxID=550540 RepID=E1SSL8_FERBD|nr:pteridine reductase [Ferrimonas balearica]ADN76047.1 short-chain dehydrogenase/reductase SDR [Ferrimonas balearica DSM 9799]